MDIALSKNYPQILCWSADHDNDDKHTHMVILAGIASIVPFSFLTLCVWVVRQLPHRLAQGDTAFLLAIALFFFSFPAVSLLVRVGFDGKEFGCRFGPCS